MSERTTVIVILLAGDDFTKGLMDALLKEIHDGVKDPNPPDVRCFYHRKIGENETLSHSYRITPGCLTFQGTTLNVSRGRYPPPGYHSHTGDLADQVHEFISTLSREGGPIRLIIGAHGNPPVGFNTYFLLARLWVLWKLLSSPLDSFLNQLTWRDRLKYLRNQVFPANDPPNGFATRSGPRPAELRADRVAGALEQLNQGRFQTLILHICTGSAVEIISALHQFPHQIACESLLAGQPMVFSAWFDTLCNSGSTPELITDHCFRTLERERHPQGCFCSYRTAGLNHVLECLDVLGTELLTLMNQPNNQATVNAITDAQTSANLAGSHNDLSFFCSLLQQKQIVPDEVLRAVMHAVCLMLVVPAKVILRDRVPNPIEQQWVGVGFYLPAYRTKDFDPCQLPESFRTHAPNWIKFLKRWQS